MSEAICVLLAENFDGFVVEGEPAIALEQATNARQHFPSLRIVCLASTPYAADYVATADQQKIDRIDARLRAKPRFGLSCAALSARLRRTRRDFRRDRSVPFV